jgi:hypothetical protein
MMTGITVFQHRYNITTSVSRKFSHRVGKGSKDLAFIYIASLYLFGHVCSMFVDDNQTKVMVHKNCPHDTLTLNNCISTKTGSIKKVSIPAESHEAGLQNDPILYMVLNNTH